MDSMYTENRTEVHPMLKKKYYLYLDKNEYHILLRSLILMKNKLIQQDRCTDYVDNLILKVITTHIR